MKKLYCNEDTCQTTPAYNYKGCSYGLYCSKHKQENMINVKNRICKIENCNKRPIYNFENEKALYCSEHKQENMINVVTIKCNEKNCKTIAYFNYKDEKSGIYCSEHKQENMVDVKSKKCVYKNCFKFANFNYENEKIGIYCSEHKQENMFCMKGKRCNEENCNKFSNFNYKDKKTGIYCLEHKKENMVDVKSKKCIENNCNTRCSYNYKNQKAIYCAKHKKENMINVEHKLCINDWCDTTITNKFNGYCFYCFIKMFPNDQLVKNYKTKEKTISSYLKEKYPNFTLIFDKVVQDGCSNKRPDIFLDLGYQIIIIEIDEHKHINYENICENKRLMEISKDVNHRPIIFIRFNPDNYILNNRKITSCWKYNKNGTMGIKESKKEEWNTRLNILSETIDYWIENKSDKIININYLFYDK
jgi:hypothetical protein